MTSLTPLIVVGVNEKHAAFHFISKPPDLCHAKRRYFEGGVSSVFLWDLEDGGFAGVVLLKKST